MDTAMRSSVFVAVVLQPVPVTVDGDMCMRMVHKISGLHEAIPRNRNR